MKHNFYVKHYAIWPSLRLESDSDYHHVIKSQVSVEFL